VPAPDCIPGGGVDDLFATNVGGRETSIEILITGSSAKASPALHSGSFAIKPRGVVVQGTGCAGIWVKPDYDLTGYAGGWSTDGSASSGSVVIDAHEGSSVKDAVAEPAHGAGSPLHISGTFTCS
jgi:hypothetical protein